MAVQDSDSYGCVLGHMPLIKENGDECVALRGLELRELLPVHIPEEQQAARAAGEMPIGS